jgi:predicted transcriptional regulator
MDNRESLNISLEIYCIKAECLRRIIRDKGEARMTDFLELTGLPRAVLYEVLVDLRDVGHIKITANKTWQITQRGRDMCYDGK